MSTDRPYLPFGRWLAGVRDGLGLTQEEAASRVGVTRPQYGRWETGRNRPDWENLVAICEALNVPIKEPADMLYPGGSSETSPWARTFAARLERRTNAMPEVKRRKLMQALDAMLSAAEAA